VSFNQLLKLACKKFNPAESSSAPKFLVSIDIDECVIKDCKDRYYGVSIVAEEKIKSFSFFVPGSNPEHKSCKEGLCQANFAKKIKKTPDEVSVPIEQEKKKNKNLILDSESTIKDFTFCESEEKVIENLHLINKE
jgi:hypothetical protein